MKNSSNNSNMRNANKGTSGVNKQFAQVHGNRGAQLNPNNQSALNNRANQLNPNNALFKGKK